MTEGGTSYVPQIGRHIQTASVVPPGAFPNGSGPGTSEETIIPGWISIVNERESAAVLAEWAAIQEAERKAKEEGDPCKRTFENEVATDGGSKPVLTAWATIEWCYAGGRVISSNTVNHGAHIYNKNLPFYLQAGEWKLSGVAHQYGTFDVTGWYVIWTFQYEYSVPIITKLEDMIVPSVTARSWISLVFELFGDGEVYSYARVGSGLGASIPLCQLLVGKC